MIDTNAPHFFGLADFRALVSGPVAHEAYLKGRFYYNQRTRARRRGVERESQSG